MDVVAGLTPHTVVVVAEKREKSVVISTVLKRMNYNVFSAQSIYGALKIIDQELPHLIIVDALLSDGTAGTLFDRLQQHRLVKGTPMLVLVSNKTKEQLTPLRGRKFAGFLLGKIDAQMIASKVKEVMAAHSNLSPYFVRARDNRIEDKLILSVKATVLGKVGDQVVYLSEAEVDGNASLVCLPDDGHRSPALLKMGSNVVKGKEIYNIFPLSRIRGKGRLWINDLPEIKMVSQETTQVMKKVLFFHPNSKMFSQFQEVLGGYGMDLIQANSIQMAAAILAREGDSIDCIYLDELSNDASGIGFKDSLAKLNENQRPIVIAGTNALGARSTSQIRYIQKPFGLGVLVEMIDAGCKAKDSFDGETANLSVTYQASAKLLGLDETGGILQLKFPVVKGSQVHLNHELLQGVWEGDSTASITNIEILAHKQDTWQAKFTATRALGNKAKYWDKVQRFLETRLSQGSNKSA